MARNTALILMLLAVVPGAALAQTPDDFPRSQTIDKTDVAGAVTDAFKLLLIEHGTRIAFHKETRDALEGPFFEDYRRSLRIPHTWEDGDSWLVNYIGHPMHGAAAARIWLDHTVTHSTPVTEIEYWKSRGWATLFSALYSLQFEFGPLSEASIGNVGMDPRTTGWVDHVVTPAGAFVILTAEDALDRYFIQWFEQYFQNKVARASVRMLFNPSRTLANISESRAPWSRPGRSLH